MVVTILTISVVSSIVFLLTPIPQSCVFFALLVSLGAVITSTLLGKKIVVKVNVSLNNIWIYIFLTLASLTLLAFQLANVHYELSSAIFYIILFAFGIGFSVLSLIKFKASFSRLEIIALSFPLSMAILAAFGVIALFIPSSIRGLVVSAVVMFTSAFALLTKIRSVKRSGDAKHHELQVNNSSLILLISIIFLVFIFVELYPQFSRILGLDISANFVQALAFSKDSLGSSFNPSTLYPLFGIYQSSVIYIVEPSLGTFQMLSVVLNIFVVLSFYAMASQYLRQYGDHIPAIATMFWSIFSGMGWVAFLTNSSSNSTSTTSTLWSLVSQADVLSYGDISWRRLFFFLSMEATFALVFALLYLLKRKDLSGKQQAILITLLMIPIPLMHPYATYLLLPLIFLVALFYSNELKKSLRVAGVSLLITAVVLLPLTWLLNLKGLNLAVSVLTFLEYSILGVVLIASVYLKRPHVKFNISRAKIFGCSHAQYGIIALFFVFFAMLLLWLSGGVSYNFNSLNDFGYVPLFLFPIKLGIAGVLAMISVFFVLSNPSYRSQELYTFLVSLILFISLCILVSSLQMHYVSSFMFSDSWLSQIVQSNVLGVRGERLFEIFKIPLAIVSSIGLGVVGFYLTKNKSKSLMRFVLVSGLVSVILVSGISSTILGFNYFNGLTNQASSSELEIISYMQNNLSGYDKAIITSPKTSSRYLEFTGATSIVTESVPAWVSKSPEFGLFVTRYAEADPTYIYLDKTVDYSALKSYSGSYLAYKANSAPVLLENSAVQVREIVNASIPVFNSDTALVIPYDVSTLSTVSPMLLEASKNSTLLSLFFEANLRSQSFSNEYVNYTNVQIDDAAYFNGVNSSIRMSDESVYPALSVDLVFRPLNIENDQVIVSKFDWGNTGQKSWEVAQSAQKIVFKVSSDGENEIVLSTPNVLRLNKEYKIECSYDSLMLKITVDDETIATRSFNQGIFKNGTDIIVGAELNKNHLEANAEMLLKSIQVLNAIPSDNQPLFQVYDFINALCINYTTILQSDCTLRKYKSIILPYDDQTTWTTLEQLEKDSQYGPQSVIVINSNGYGPMLNLFGNESEDAFTAGKIQASNYNVQLHSTVEVQKLTLNDNAKAMAQYTNDEFSSPLVIKATQGNLTLVYLNMYPILSQNLSVPEALIYRLGTTLSEYFRVYDPTTVTDWFIQPSLLFSKFDANGTITIKSNSCLIITGHQLLNNSFNSVTINTTQASVNGGYGFYTLLTVLNPALNASEDFAKSQVIEGNVTFLVRQPDISINGSVQFEDFFMLHPPTIHTDGRTTTLSGNVNVRIFMSDHYSVALPYELSSPVVVTYKNPFMEFDESSALVQLLPYLIVIVIIAIPILLIAQSKLPDSKGIR